MRTVSLVSLTVAGLCGAAWAQAQAGLEALRTVAAQMPEVHRKALSGGAANAIRLAEAWAKGGPPGMAAARRSQSAPAGAPGIAAAWPGIIPVSNPRTDFLYSRLTGFTQSETSTAWCGNHVVVGFNDSGSLPESALAGGGATMGLSFNGLARSTDRGASYDDLGFLYPGSDPSNFLMGDPVLACANPATFYYASQTGVFPNVLSAISISRSTDGGATFGDPVIAAGKPLLHPVALSPQHFLDKDWMAVDPADPNRIYVTYTDFDSSGTACGPGVPRAAIELVRSADGGLTWSAPLAISQVCGGAVVQGSQVVVGRDGEVFVAWENFAPDRATRDIRIRKSTDHGLSFQPPVRVSNVICVGDCSLLQGGFRSFIDLNGLAVDRTEGPGGGTVYVTWQDGRNLQAPEFLFPGTYGFSDILVSKSVNGGLTWSVPVRVNSNPEPVSSGRGTDQFQPQVAVDHAGRVAVCWYDRRADPLNLFVDRFCAVSTNRGRTWPNIRIGPHAWAPWKATDEQVNPFYMGDYDGIATDFSGEFPGFVNAFQIIRTADPGGDDPPLAPNPDVVAVRLDPQARN